MSICAQAAHFVKTVSFVDVENIELPNEIETYSRLGGSSTVAYLAVDNFSFLNELEAYQTIVYNQVIAIPPQVSRQRELEKKMKNTMGQLKNAPSNAIVAQEIQELLHDIAVNGQLIVDAHFSLVFACDTLEKMEKTQSTIESKLFTKGIIISKNAYNQMELFRSAIIGNAVELQDYDCLLQRARQACVFF